MIRSTLVVCLFCINLVALHVTLFDWQTEEEGEHLRPKIKLRHELNGCDPAFASEMWLYE